MKTKQKKVKVGDIISCNDFSWNVQVLPTGLVKCDKIVDSRKPMIHNLTVLALSKEGFPTSDKDGNVSADPEKILSKYGKNSFGSLGPYKMNDMMVQDTEGRIFFLRSDLNPYNRKSLREELKQKETAIEKWDKIIYDIDDLHQRIATPCGFCKVYAYNNSDCPLWTICAGCRADVGIEESEYYKTLDALLSAEGHAERMLRAISENIDECEKKLDA